MITAISLERPNLLPKNDGRLLKVIESAKTGLSITQLMRPPKSCDQEPVGDTEIEPKKVDNSHFRLYEPYHCLIDYLRVEGVIDKRELERLKAFLFPKREEYGISTTLYPVSEPFFLASTFKMYDHQFIDAMTGSKVAYNVITTRPLPVHPKILLWLYDINPQLVEEPIEEEEADMVRVVVNLPGRYWDGKDMLDYWRISQRLKVLNFRCMRIDLRIDFPKELRILEQALECHEKRLVGGVRKGRAFSGEIEYGDPSQIPSEGLALGSRTSELYMRIYETEEKHGFDAHRVECEFKGAKARVVWELLNQLSPYRDSNDKLSRMSNLEFKRLLQQHASEICLGQVTFYSELERRANRSIKKSVVAGFWEKAREATLCLLPNKITIPTPEKSVSKLIGWIHRQVAPSLAILSEGLKGEFGIFLRDAMSNAKERFTDKHRAMVECIEQVKDVLINNILGEVDLEFANSGTINHKFKDSERQAPLTSDQWEVLRKRHSR